MFCPNCGTQLAEGNGYCTACGAAVTSENRQEQGSFPDPTVLPTPEQGRIDPNKLVPEPQPQQSVDINSVVENLNRPEPEPIVSKNGFTDEDMAWFTDHQPQSPPLPQYPHRYHPQQPPVSQPQPPNMPPQANPQYFSQIPKPVDLTPRKSNFLLGFIGALVFSLIGCVIWIIIGRLGFISYIGALAMSFLVITGYKLLGKRFDITGLLVSLIVVAAAVFASNVFILAIDVSDALDELKTEMMEMADGYEVTEESVEMALDMLGLNSKGFTDVFLHFFDYAENIDEYASYYTTDTVMGTFRFNLILGYVFAGIAFVVVAIPQMKANS